MAFPCLQELAAVQNFNSLTDAMSIYIERKINEDLHFAAVLSHLWEVLYSRVNEHKLLIAELNVFGGPLALQCAEFFKKLSQTEVLKKLEIRKSIAEVHMQVHKKIDFFYSYEVLLIRLWIVGQITKVNLSVGLFVSHIKSFFESDFVSLDPRFQSKKSAMDRSFTLGPTEEDDNVKILQSCNGLLPCGGSGMHVFDYVYNPSTNQYKKLPYLDCSLDNSPYYSSAGLRIAFDLTKSSGYKLVDAGRTFCDIDIQIYSSEPGNWSLCSDRFNDFSFDHFDSAMLVNSVQCLEHYFGKKGTRWLGKIVQYNLISKTFHEIYDFRSNQVDDNHDDDDDDADDDELLQVSLGFGSEEPVLIGSFLNGVKSQVLDELMEITGSTELHKCMRFWFVQEIAEEEGLLKFLRDRCDDLRRKNARHRVLIREMEALGERGVAVGSLESLKQTHARETAKLVALADVIAESLAGIHEKERHVAKLDLND
uniref:Uncharacterized protein n=1 Tax=Tanacetum cinerariifolium TaxID=118510 RepID=A0A6L2JMV7_TANCI|nr:hypothetical protein [Tanacetum cinerariifolium]